MAVTNLDITIARDAIAKIGDPNLKAALEALLNFQVKSVGSITADIINAVTQYNINGSKVLDDTELTFGTTELNQTALVIDGTQVVGVQQPVISDPTGGGTVDTESRAAIVLMLAAMEAHGLIAT